MPRLRSSINKVKNMIDRLKELIENYKIRIEATDRQFDDELLKNGMNMQTNILYGYKSCYEEVARDLEKIVQSFSNGEN